MMPEAAPIAAPPPPPQQKPSLMLTNMVGKQSKRHHHVAYLHPDGSGVTSADNGHSHDYVVMQTPQGWGRACSPAQDGHTHTLSPMEGKEKETPKGDAELVAEVRTLFKEAKEYEADSRKKADESEEFRKGNQWTAAHRQELEGKQRACLTINEITSKLDILSGYQRQNRTDIHYLPVEEGDARIADILNALTKNICEQNNFEYEETQVFEDQIASGRGHYNIYIDREENPQGDIVIERYPRREVWFGPHEKLDASDAEYALKSKWVSLGWAEGEWPDKAKKLVPSSTAFEDRDDPHHNKPGEQYDISTNKQPAIAGGPDPDFVNIAKKEYRIIECQRKEYRRVPVVGYQEDDFFANIEGIGADNLAKVKTIPFLSVFRQKKTRVRLTTIINDVLLADEYPEDLSRDFSIIPAYAYKAGKDWWGKVEGAKDPQRESNKRHSQMVDILNKVAAYGWFGDKNTFETPQEEDKFKKNSSSPGFYQRIRNVDKPPSKVEGIKFPGELASLIELSGAKLREIMNINPELMGINSKAESGVAIVEKKRQGLLGNEFLFDNLNFSKKLLGRTLVALIQKAYDPKRIMRVIANRNVRSPVEIAGKKMDEYPQEELLALLTEADLTKYDVVVSESAFSPTNRNANFIAWSTLAMQGAPVPLTLLVELSDLPNKAKAMEQIQAEIQAKAQETKAKMDTEIQKSQIAAQSKAGGAAGTAAMTSRSGMPTQ